MYLMFYVSNIAQINSVRSLQVIFFLGKKSYSISLPKYIQKAAIFFLICIIIS